MKRNILAVALAGWFCACASGAPVANEQEQQEVAALAKEVRQQQADIAANQAKIEATVAQIAESLRLARIYVSRAGIPKK